MRRILYSVLFGLAVVCVPKLASAAPCNPSHTFITGEVLTASILNSNPVTFSGCLNNIDNTNLGSAGIYASQIKPTNSSQATFGNSISYVFQGGLTSLSTVLANSGSNPAFTSTANDGQPILLFNSNSSGNETSLGVNTSSGYPYFSLAQLSSGGSFQKWIVGVDSNDNFNVPSGSIVTPNNFVFGGASGGTLYGVSGGGHSAGDIANTGTTSSGNFIDSGLSASQCMASNGSKQFTSSGEQCPISVQGGTRLGGLHTETVTSTSVAGSSTNAFTFSQPYNGNPVCTVATIGSVAPAFSITSVTTTTVTVFNSSGSTRNYEAICSGW